MKKIVLLRHGESEASVCCKRWLYGKLLLICQALMQNAFSALGKPRL